MRSVLSCHAAVSICVIAYSSDSEVHINHNTIVHGAGQVCVEAMEKVSDCYIVIHYTITVVVVCVCVCLV